VDKIMSKTSPLKSRFQGAILGTMVGDALGKPVEGLDGGRIKAMLDAFETLDVPRQHLQRTLLGLLGGYDDENTARYTDDTQMTLALTEAIIVDKGVVPETVAQCFVAHFQSNRGYALGAQRVIAALREGADWREPAPKLFGGRGSFGNGAAMRAAPVGLWYYDSPIKLREAAEAQAKITHTHPLGMEGAVLQAMAVALALKTPFGELSPLAFAQTLHDAVSNLGDVSDVYQKKMTEVIGLLENPLPMPQVALLLGTDISAPLSVPAAIYAFLSHPNSFSEAVLYAVKLGGDTDTIGAMCGAIAGTYHGIEAIPKNWFNALENGAHGRDYALGLASQFYDTLTKQFSYQSGTCP
jgi:poly(ADP-ribose) glycohydrolase ARH3